MMVKIDQHMPQKKGKKEENWKKQSRSIMLNNEVNNFKKASKDNFITLMVSAMGLVTALSWNDAIKSTIANFFPSDSYVYKLYAALTVTIIAVVLTYILVKMRTNKS